MGQGAFAKLFLHLPIPIGEWAVADAVLEAEQKSATDHHAHENEMRPPCARKNSAQQTSRNKQDMKNAQKNIKKRQHELLGFTIEKLRFTNATQSTIINSKPQSHRAVV